MNLYTKQVSAMARWMAGNGKGTRPDLKKVQEILGLENGSIARDDYESDGHFAYPADTADFDPDDIEDELGPCRYEEISNGLEPTLEELEIWAKKTNSLVFEEDGGWYHFYLWKVELPDEQIYFRSLHGDGGILDVFDGPFESEEEALIDAGNLEMNPRL